MSGCQIAGRVALIEMEKIRLQKSPLLLLSIVLLAYACGPGDQAVNTVRVEASITPLNVQLAAAVTLPPVWTPSPTAPPTATPLPSQTPLPSATSIAGEKELPPIVIVTGSPSDPDTSDWQRIETEMAEFWIADGFEVLEFGADFAAFFEVFFTGFVEAFAEGFGELSAESGATPLAEGTALDLPAIDLEFFVAVEPDEQVSFVMIREAVEPGATLTSQMETNIGNLEEGYTATEAQIIADARYSTGRFFVSFNDIESGLEGRQVVYVIVVEGNAWSLLFAAEQETFTEWLPLFEKTVQSVTILP